MEMLPFLFLIIFAPLNSFQIIKIIPIGSKCLKTALTLQQWPEGSSQPAKVFFF